ncbi:MAG: DUF1214 domain-containing protein [Actinomycetota bacterium]|nr:DUF1214 domain-containing protein [Actinomycetota bacterium]
MPVHVNIDNFARAESDRMFGDLAAAAGGVNRWMHVRRPTPVSGQTVIRMNRDTLYSFAVVDLSGPAAVTLPDAGDRYLSVMIVNQDHYINTIIHAPGRHELTAEEQGTRYVLVAARTLVDPADAADVQSVNELQDQLQLETGESNGFEHPEYDTESLDATRRPLLQLAGGVEGFDRTFGRREDVDPVRHLLGAAAGWGGLPETEAFYVNVSPGLPVGTYEVRVADVPVDAFWSISMYNAEGFFEQNEYDAYSVNDITATKDADGAVTVRFGTEPDGAPNFLPIGEGWNYIVRLYRPRADVLDGTWTFPGPQPVS